MPRRQFMKIRRAAAEPEDEAGELQLRRRRRQTCRRRIVGPAPPRQLTLISGIANSFGRTTVAPARRKRWKSALPFRAAQKRTSPEVRVGPITDNMHCSNLIRAQCPMSQARAAFTSRSLLLLNRRLEAPWPGAFSLLRACLSEFLPGRGHLTSGHVSGPPVTGLMRLRQ
jgi:hypothetical protein